MFIINPYHEERFEDNNKARFRKKQILSLIGYPWNVIRNCRSGPAAAKIASMTGQVFDRGMGHNAPMPGISHAADTI
jgi:hypothetical protein